MANRGKQKHFPEVEFLPLKKPWGILKDGASPLRMNDLTVLKLQRSTAPTTKLLSINLWQFLTFLSLQ